GPDRVRRLAAASADALLFTGAGARDRFAARVAVPSRSLLLPLSATADPVAAERSARALIGLCREAVAWSCANWAGRDLLLS
ncbi:MAG: hypothetical protein K9G59_18895, partial [Caulobacter sp.]|nr:hypothetical protein [Caulobacter sp.]